MAAVIVVGSYNTDHVWRVDTFPRPGETRRGSGFSTGPGGKGFNQAMACVRQGADTLFLGARGQDALGDNAARSADHEGIQCCWQTCADVPTGSACIMVDAEGENQIVVDLAANDRLATDFLHAQDDAFGSARVLLVQLETSIDAVMAALELAGDHGMLRILNPAPVHPDLTRDLVRQADVLTPNESEFALLCGRFLDIDVNADGIAAMDDSTLHALARRLTGGSVVVTLGQQGCFISHGDARRGDDGEHYRVAAETVQPVDTTAAGDAFCGALAAGLVRLDGQPFAAAVRHANRVAAMTTERHGAATAIPTLDEVTTRFS